ncbi:Sorting nexin, cytoplasm-to-vacuole targeting pathway/endosomal sorting, partial [Coemansia sp. RSA 2618]
NLQLEGVEGALVRERAKLEALLQADDEAKRLAQALENNHGQHASANGDRAQQPVRRYSSAEEESLLSDAVQPQGFVTPQRANTDASSMHGGAAAAAAASGSGAAAAGRSRGPSVSSAVSAGIHAEFTPTLAPRGIPGSADAPARSPATQPTSLNVPRLHPRARPRSGTAASIASTSTNRRDSNGWVVPGNEHSTRHGEPENDDPLAQFQQEESQLWGGGAGSTLPRLGARARGQLKQPASRRNSQAVDDADGAADAFGIYPEPQGNMAQSEYITRNALDAGDRSHAFGGPSSKLAASTPTLWDAPDERDVAGDHMRPPLAGNAVASSSDASSVSTTSFGVRLLRSPKVLGDGIMNRLTYALNGMMDVDPEQMRHNQIGRASDKISLLEDQLEMLSNDMTLINTSTQDNLDRFQKQKVRDLKGVLISMARMHLEWAEKNLEIWKEAKMAVDEV